MKLPIFVDCGDDPIALDTYESLKLLVMMVEVYDADSSKAWFSDGQVIELRVEEKKFWFISTGKELKPTPVDRHDVDGLRASICRFLEALEQPFEQSASLEQLVAQYIKFDADDGDDVDDDDVSN